MNPNPIERWRWGVVWLLFLATLINYTDRMALVAVQRHVVNEFAGADKKAQDEFWGSLLLAFGISYGLFQVLAGLLIDRFRLRLLYVGAIVVWSTAGVLTGFAPAGAVAILMACRVVLGIGESYNWPCAVATIRRIIPRESRGLANGIFHSGASIGAVATPLLALLMVGTDGSGWRNLFMVVGSIGFAWAVLWLVFTHGERGAIIDAPPPPDPGVSDSEQDRQPFVAVFGLRHFWICLITGICVNLCWHVYNSWFGRYLQNTLEKDAQTEQWMMAGFFIAADLGSMASGWTIRRLTSAGFRVERSRQIVMIALACLTMLSVPAVLLGGSPDAQNKSLSLALFYVVAAAAMGGFAIFFSLAQDIIGRHTALLVGFCGATSWIVLSIFSFAMSKIVGLAERQGADHLRHDVHHHRLGACPGSRGGVGVEEDGAKFRVKMPFR